MYVSNQIEMLGGETAVCEAWWSDERKRARRRNKEHDCGQLNGAGTYMHAADRHADRQTCMWAGRPACPHAHTHHFLRHRARRSLWQPRATRHLLATEPVLELVAHSEAWGPLLRASNLDEILNVPAK